MREFLVVNVLDDELAVRAARNHRLLRSHGMTIRKLADTIIGTCCIGHGWPLLHADRDFEAMQRHLGLEVVSLDPC